VATSGPHPAVAKSDYPGEAADRLALVLLSVCETISCLYTLLYGILEKIGVHKAKPLFSAARGARRRREEIENP
jgi:hypothetical protein